VTGGDQRISTDSVIAEISSPDVPDLTLIDLPGIVRTTTAGQRKDIIHSVDALIDKYLNQPRTIVLAVIPSNMDIATVDILERAQKAVPAVFELSESSPNQISLIAAAKKGYYQCFAMTSNP
jgi:interferon-induced GTP-binding protein Mx1